MSTSAKQGARGYELELSLCKRPLESWLSLASLQKPRADSTSAVETNSAGDEQHKSIISDFKHKIQPDQFARRRISETSVSAGRLRALKQEQTNKILSRILELAGGCTRPLG